MKNLLISLIAFVALATPNFVSAANDFESFWLTHRLDASQTSITRDSFQYNRNNSPQYVFLSGLSQLGYATNWENSDQMIRAFYTDNNLPYNSKKISYRALKTLDTQLFMQEDILMTNISTTLQKFSNVDIQFADHCEFEPMLYYFSLLSEVADNYTENYRNALHELKFECDIQGPRGWGGQNKIVIQTSHLMSKDKFQNLFIHELGHVIADHEGASGYKSHQVSEFSDNIAIIDKNDKNIGFFEISWISSTQQRIGSKRQDFVSGYSTTSPHEELAETMLAYSQYGKNLRHLADSSSVMKAKYDFMKNIYFNGKEFNTGTDAPLPIVWDLTGE